jgi:hypothetical protein
MPRQDFVRYYIRKISRDRCLKFWAQVPELAQWQMIGIGEFDYQHSYGYAEGTNDRRVSCIREYCDVIVEHHRPREVMGGSCIWTGGQRVYTTVLDDVLQLLSLATCQHVHTVLREYSHDGTLTLSSFHTSAPKPTQTVVGEDSLGNFISNSLAKLRTRDWMGNSGFDPAIYWYRTADAIHEVVPNVLEIAMFWVTMEVLAKARDFEGHGPPHKRTMVEDMVAQRGFTGADWDFLGNALIDWYDVRNATFHEGQQPNWDQARLEARWKQIIEFASFVLVDLLVPQPHDQKARVAAQIKAYLP